MLVKENALAVHGNAVENAMCEWGFHISDR